MNEIPTPEKCIELLKEEGCCREVINHCVAVNEIALRIAKKTDANLKLVEAGALLHDIGRAKTHGITHAIEGVKIAKRLNLSDEIIAIIRNHIGAGLTIDEAKKLGLPAEEYIPLTLEEKIVCHADNLIDNCKFQPIEKEITRAINDGNSEYAKRLETLHEELSDLVGFDLNEI